MSGPSRWDGGTGAEGNGNGITPVSARDWFAPTLKEDMDYQITVRYGRKSQRYLTLPINAKDARSALHMAADSIPEDLIPEVDLVELRHAPDFDKTFPESDSE